MARDTPSKNGGFAVKNQVEKSGEILHTLGESRRGENQMSEAITPHKSGHNP